MALDSITGMPTLPITSKARAAMPAAPKGYMGPKEIAPMEEELQTEIGKARQKVGEADINIEKAKREEKALELETQAKGAEKFVKDIEEMPTKKELEERRAELSGMKFIPTRDTVQDVAGLFSLISVIGMVVGKKNAQQAMGAMNGMMEGHRKGRSDLFKQEAMEFDKNFKAMQTNVTNALAAFKEALEVRKYDKEAGQLREQAALMRMESPLLKATYEKQGPMGVLNRLEEIYKSATQTAPQLINNLQKAEDDRSFKERELAQRERQHRETLAAKAGGGALPKDTKTRTAYEFRDLAIDNVKDILNDLKDPEIRRLIGPENKYMPDVILNLQDKYPVLAQKLARFQSKEFELGGKNLTGSEQKILEPIYGWRGLTAKALEDNLTEAVRFMNKEQARVEKDYPGLAQQPYAAPTPKAEPSSFDTERSNARAAIAAGAPEDKVRERFKQKTGQEL